MTILDIIGLVSGLLAIFTFTTGATSIGELRRRTARRNATGQRGGAAGDETVGGVSDRRSRPRLVLFLSVPVFLVSLVVTLSAGLNGSDTGGAQFVLLLEGAALLLLYATRLRRRLPWGSFLTLCMGILGASGWVMGTISRGEQVAGLLAGIVIGAAVGLLGLAFRGAGERTSPRSRGVAVKPSRTEQEREVLRIARQNGGEISAAQVAVDTSISLDEAKIALEQLAERGFCERHVRTGGAIVYRFPDFLPG